MYHRRLPNSKAAVAALRSTELPATTNVTSVTNSHISSQQDDIPVSACAMEAGFEDVSVLNLPLENAGPIAKGDDSDLSELLDNCGLTLSLSPEKPSLLHVDHLKFTKSVVTATRNESIAEKVLGTFCPLLEDETTLKALLLPTEQETTQENAATADSVIRMLLRVPRLQPTIAQQLFSIGEKLCKEGGETKSELLEMIVNQFRYLESVTDSHVLMSSLLNFARVAPSWLLAQIFHCISEVLMDEYHDTAGGRLCELMEEKPALTQFILDTLACLSLSNEVAIELKEKLSDSISSMDANQLKSALKFLLQCQSLSDAENTICKLRGRIVIERFFVEGVPDKVEFAVRFGRNIGEAVSKVYDRKKFISMIGDVRLQTFDLFLLFLLLRTRYQRQARLIIRLHVKEGRIDSQSITELFRHQEYLTTSICELLDLASEIFESSEERLTKFACAVYDSVFHSKSDTHKEDAMIALIGHCASGNAQIVDNALDFFMRFSSTNAETCLDYDYLLAGLLNLVPRFNLTQMRLCVHMITKVALSDTQTNCMLMDVLLINIRKFLSCSSLRLQAVGVVAIFAVLSVASKSTDVLEQLLSEASERITDSHFLAALMYDELAEMIETHGFLDETMQRFAEDAKAAVKSLQFRKGERSLSQSETILFENTTGTTDCLIDFAKFIEVGEEAFLHSDEELCPRVLTLCPLIRFFGSYIFSKQGQNDELLHLADLPFVYASRSAIEKFASSSEDVQKRLIRLIFHCSNWLREVLNVTMKAKCDRLYSLALQKLSTLLSMQGDLETCLSKMTLKSIDLYTWNYAFQQRPSLISKTLRTQKSENQRKIKTNRNKRRKKASEEQTEQGDLEVATSEEMEQSSEVKGSTGRRSASDKAVSVNPSLFREYDIALFDLISLDVDFKRAENTPLKGISIDALEHILRDLDRKIESRAQDDSKHFWWLKNVDDNATTKFQRLPNEKLQEFLSFVVPLLYKDLEACRLYLSGFVDSYDGILDHPKINSEEVATTGRCVELLLSCLHHSYLCNSSILKSDVLSDKFVSNEETSEENKVEVTVLYLLQFTDLCRTFSAASSLLRLVKVLTGPCTSRVLKEAIGGACVGVLKRNWSVESTWLVFSRHVSQMLNICLWSQDDNKKLEFLEDLATKSMGEALESDSFESITYPTFRKETLHTWYHFLLVTLCEDAKKAEYRLSALSTQEKFLSWALSVRLFRFLTCTVLQVHKSSVLRTAVKEAPSYVSAFTNSAVRLLDVNFEELLEHVRPILQAMQQSTRTLQNMCTQLKVNKDKTLIRFVPACKRTLEEFVFRVKAMMAANKCLDAVQIANLKTRNLKGEEILLSSTDEDDSAASGGEDGQSAEEEEESKQDEQ